MQPPPGSSLSVRASDADREHVVAELGAHLVAGRLSLEEFSARVDGADRASTLAELRELTADLPAPARAQEAAEPEAEAEPRERRPRPPFWPGNLPFIEQFETDASAKAVMREAMQTVVPRLIAEGYEIEVSEPRLLVLTKVYRPAWTIALSIFLFPLGLLALMHIDRCQVVLTIERGRTTSVEVAGTAPLAVRRAVHMLGEGS